MKKKGYTVHQPFYTASISYTTRFDIGGRKPD
jgi:hypothetical protein